MTGPKKLVSSVVPGLNVMIGVPTCLPVRDRASSVSSRTTASCSSSSPAAVERGREAGLLDGLTDD